MCSSDLLSGDLAALGKAAGNFPSVFSSKVESKWYSPPRLQRSGPAGLAGALIGSQLGGLEGSIAGGAAGAGGAEIASMLAARHITSPAYQAGLKIPDLRIAPSSAWTPAPVAAPPETNALVQRDNANALRAAEFERRRQVAGVQARAEMEAAAKKAREEAQGFAEIEARAKDARARAEAAANRERLMDFADELEEALRVESKQKLGQGPKTRSARRNKLAEEAENRNALAR